MTGLVEGVSAVSQHLVRNDFDRSSGILQGWWSYEVCFMSHINQFHAEQNRLVESHSLGLSLASSSQLCIASICLSSLQLSA